MDDLLKRLRDYEEYEQSRDGQIVCVKSDITQEAADRIKQLEAENRELALQVLASGGQAQEAYEAQLKAEAATAAAYEVAAREVECGCGAGPCQDTANCAAKDAAAIRALATPDQTAALDKLIAEAEARGKTIGIATEKIRRLIEWLGEDDCNVFLLPHDDVVKMRAILASKKGGV